MSGKAREMLCMGGKNQSNKINSAYFSNNVYAKSLQAGTTLCVANQAPLSMGFSKQEYWSGLPYPPPPDHPDPGIELTSLMSPVLMVRPALYR